MHRPHIHPPLLSRADYLRRLSKNGLVGLGLIAGALGIGTIGYRTTAGLSWIDSLLNASMILTGMGPVNPMTSTPAKLFASFYAIFSGVAFLTIMGVVLAPMAHRFLHRFHLDMDDSAGPARADGPGANPSDGG